MSKTGEDLVVDQNAATFSPGQRVSLVQQEDVPATQPLPSPDMAIITDDTILHPHIDGDVLLYVTCLNEGYETYTRFFDALLIKRQSHRAFFRDLKAFREQPQLISLLDRAGDDRTLYKKITLVFLNSRFAHPWCRKTPLKKGFWRSEWGTIEGKEKDAETTKEEQRLHKLLVPIWILMRGRMFPSRTIVEKFCEEEREKRELQKQDRLTTSSTNELHAEAESSNESLPDSLKNSDSEDETRDREQEEQAATTHVMTSVFRLAAAGMLISQTPRRKLRWLVKKPK